MPLEPPLDGDEKMFLALCVIKKDRKHLINSSLKPPSSYKYRPLPSVRARDIAKKNEATKAPSQIDSRDDMPSPPYLRGRRACVEACPGKGTPVMASKASACIASKFGATNDKASGQAQRST